MNVGIKLKEIRKKAKLTQKQLALKLGNGGYTEFTVSAIENGKRKVGFDVCEDWAAACGFVMIVDFVEIFKETGHE